MMNIQDHPFDTSKCFGVAEKKYKSVYEFTRGAMRACREQPIPK